MILSTVKVLGEEEDDVKGDGVETEEYKQDT